MFTDLIDSLAGISEPKIHSYFVSKAIGAKSKSLASTIRSLILNDLQLKGWSINWSPFRGNHGFESAMWNFDAAKLVHLQKTPYWLTLEISFDNRLALGTHLVKSRVANNFEFRKDPDNIPVLHHCIIAASQSFKNMSGLDNSVATAEEFVLASRAYAPLGLSDMTLISLNALETIEVLQKKNDGRTKSKLLNLEIN